MDKLSDLKFDLLEKRKDLEFTDKSIVIRKLISNVLLSIPYYEDAEDDIIDEFIAQVRLRFKITK